MRLRCLRDCFPWRISIDCAQIGTRGKNFGRAVPVLTFLCLAFFHSFSEIYARKFWGGPYGKPDEGSRGANGEICLMVTPLPASGPGSSPANTAKLRSQLPALLRELNVSSILDIGCGREAED
jgi:hypothetical protein